MSDYEEPYYAYDEEGRYYLTWQDGYPTKHYVSEDEEV